MTENLTKIKKFQDSLDQIKKSLSFDKKVKEITKLQKESASPGFWEDKEKAKSLMKKLGLLKDEIDKIEEIGTSIEDAKAADDLGMKNELDAKLSDIESKLNSLELSTYLSGDYDNKNAIVSIHAGQGGTEAMDWASMLYRMYTRYFEKKGWNYATVELSEGEEAGIKSVVMTVNGLYAYGYLKGEAGTHRLVRQSPFNADKLRQTSFALVEVMPELNEVDLPDIKIEDKDIEWQFFRASTQGGQNVQKVSTAVRLTHKPTGIAVTAQAERYQEQNRKIALNLLRSKLWLKKQKEQEEEKKNLKGEYRPASWGNQIRSYVLHPYKMVKDLRTQVETSDYEKVLAGDLDKFIEAELKLK